MVAVYGNLMVMGIAVALFVATINLGKRQTNAADAEGKRAPRPEPTTQH